MLEARIAIDAGHATPEFALDCFAAVLERLDAHPEPVKIKVDAPPGMAVDIDPFDGCFIVRTKGAGSAKRDFRRRWIADHAVPLSISRRIVPPRLVALVAAPAGGNRVRVRETFASRLAFLLSCALLYFIPCRRNGT